MIHVSVLRGFGKSESEAAEIGGGHFGISTEQTVRTISITAFGAGELRLPQ
jgi:hypothetical protein